MHYLLRHMTLVFPNLGAVCQGDVRSLSWPHLQRTEYCENIRRNYVWHSITSSWYLYSPIWLTISDISGSQGGEYEDGSLLGCSTP
jgi:hypothetical protein